MHKYFVAHLISGDAKTYHERLTRDLSTMFRIFPLHERVVPHITIKAPFECDEEGIQEVERVIRSYVHNEVAPNMLMKGFGRFGFRTVYLDIDRSPDAVSFVRRAIKTINENVSWISRSPLEGNKLHASVARFMTMKQSRRVRRYVREMKPHFTMELDNIAILKKEGRQWKVETIIAVPSRMHATLPSVDFVYANAS